MTWGFFDRVRDTTTSTGTGNIVVSGSAPTGFRSFAEVYTIGQKVPYVIDSGGADWEVGRGVYSAANTITRTRVTASSNGGNPVNFGAGTKSVWVDITAYFANDVDTHGQVIARSSFQALR